MTAVAGRLSIDLPTAVEEFFRNRLPVGHRESGPGSSRTPHDLRHPRFLHRFVECPKRFDQLAAKALLAESVRLVYQGVQFAVAEFAKGWHRSAGNAAADHGPNVIRRRKLVRRGDQPIAVTDKVA